MATTTRISVSVGPQVPVTILAQIAVLVPPLVPVQIPVAVQAHVPVPIPPQIPLPPPIQNPARSATKKRKRNPADWERNRLKCARIKGKHYVGRHKTTIARQLLDVNCTCIVLCTNKLTAAQKQTIFDNYCSLSSHTEQTLYLRGCVVAQPGRRNKYILKIQSDTINVCQKYFVGLHGIKKSRLRKKVLNLDVEAADSRGKHTNHVGINQAALINVRAFLNGLEARESHYSCAKNGNRKYLECYESVSSLYKRFLEQHPLLNPTTPTVNGQKTVETVKFWVFEKIFNYEFNISFGYPRSDICEVCEQFHVEKKQSPQAQVQSITTRQEAHWLEAEKFYESMQKSTLVNLPQNECCLCFDFQKNLPLPVTNVTAEYFLSQLWIFNFCIRNLRKEDSTMFVYSEHFARKGSNEVISALMYYIQNYVSPNIRVLKLWCDNSFAQNKNRYLIAVLRSLCGSRFDEIVLTFPIPGQSRMSCDRDFAMIEIQKKKNDKFNFPSDWIQLIKSAQPSKPFNIVYLEHALTDDLCDDGTPVAGVFDYKSVLDPLLKPPSGINRFRRLRMSNSGALFYKTDHASPEIRTELLKNGISLQDLRTKINACPRAFNDYVPLKPKKIINVKKLLKNVFIPPEKIFYESLDL